MLYVCGGICAYNGTYEMDETGLIEKERRIGIYC